MKFSVLLFPLVVQLSLCARPAGGGHEIIVGNQHEHGANTTLREADEYCTEDRAQKTLLGRCKPPGKDIFDYIWTYTNMLGIDYHGWCPVLCCDRYAKKLNDMCLCTAYGERYDTTWDPNIIGANSPSNCCGRDDEGKPSIEGGKCGCIALGQTGAYGTDLERDCCSFTGKDGVCVKRACAKKGEDGRCCRLFGNNTVVKSGKCPCFHGGDRRNVNDDVGWENCCAGHANEAKNACGCIKEGSKSLPDGADERDCCSGKTTADKKYCVAGTCLAVGATVTGGAPCCSGQHATDKTGENRCKCISSGEDIPAGGTHADCCSNIADKDKQKCAYLFKGETLVNGTKPEDVCWSGHATELGECRCVGQKQKTKDKTQCCSGTFGADGACGCLPVNSVLADGAQHADCCTRTASRDGVCRCAAAGAPVPEGNVSNCCAGADASGQFCSCHVAGSEKPPIVEAISDLCCGGSSLFDHKNSECACIPTGSYVAHWVPAKACCSSTKMDAICLPKDSI